MLPLAPWRSPRASSTPEAQVSTLKPGGSLNFDVGNWSAAVGIGNAGIGAMRMADSFLAGRPLAHPGSSEACWEYDAVAKHASAAAIATCLRISSIGSLLSGIAARAGRGRV